MYDEYIEEDEIEYPWGFYYNWASDMLSEELSDLTHDPSGYLESMSWDPEEWLEKVDVRDADYTSDQVVELAGILKKYFEKYAETEDIGEATIDTMCENEVEDFIANTIAGCIQSAASA